MKPFSKLPPKAATLRLLADAATERTNGIAIAPAAVAAAPFRRARRLGLAATVGRSCLCVMPCLEEGDSSVAPAPALADASDMPSLSSPIGRYCGACGFSCAIKRHDLPILTASLSRCRKSTLSLL